MSGASWKKLPQSPGALWREVDKLKKEKEEPLAEDFGVRAELEALKNQIQDVSEQVAKLSTKPQTPSPPEKERDPKPCSCVLTKEGFWARFHQLRSEGLNKSDAFRIVSQEVIEAALIKSQAQVNSE